MELIFKSIETWQLSYGDKTIFSWIIVFLYLLAAYTSFRLGAALSKSNQSIFSYENIFWYFISGLMIFLAFNKQLDLQSLLTILARDAAIRNGWWAVRRSYQFWFIGGMLAMSTGLLIFFIYILRGTIKNNYLAIMGLFLLLVFILVRAISFHHFDKLIGLSFIGIEINFMLEFSGIILIITSGIINYRIFKTQT